MKIIGNILLVPIKIIFLAGYLISIIGFICVKIIEYLSGIIVGMLISLCVILIIASFLLYGTNILDNPASLPLLIAFGFSLAIAFIPFVFLGLKSFFKKGLLFWF